jgi:peptidyl-prolyl cis-trans isomerase C
MSTNFGATVKKDLLISLAVALIVIGICFGLASIKLDLKPTPSKPFTTAAVGEAVGGRVILRVNGEPVTEAEFEAAFAQLPEDAQRQLANPGGKTAFAEQLVRYKLLEQEARRLGVEKDPRVAAALSSDRMNILAAAAAQKLVATPTDQAVRDFYKKNAAAFESVDVSHILIAYAGGMAPPRAGGNPPPEAQAMTKAREVVKQLRAGANFAQMAVQVSDDVGSVERGGDLGTIGHNALPPELDQKVFALKEGQISDPIPSRFGIHIFLVRKRGAQPMDKVQKAIVQRVKNQNTLDRIEVLRKQAKVDFDPKYFPDQQKPTPTKKPS